MLKIALAIYQMKGRPRVVNQEVAAIKLAKGGDGRVAGGPFIPKDRAS